MRISVASYLRGISFLIRYANIKEHAKRELELAGLFDKDSDYDGMVGKAVMELCKCFSGQGHSGFSANLVLDIFNKLGKYRTLSPITDDPNEWMEISKEMSGKESLWQNKRDPSIFSENKGKTWYCVDDKKKKKNKSKNYKTASVELKTKVQDVNVRNLTDRQPKSLEELQKEFPDSPSLKKIFFKLNREKWYRTFGSFGRYIRDYGEETRDGIEQTAYEEYIQGTDMGNLLPVLKERNPGQFGKIKEKFIDRNQNKPTAFYLTKNRD